jgi:hypothetical protein
MTMGLSVAVIATLLAMLVETMVFWRRRAALKAKEQSFSFHDLRDRLQLLSIERKIDQHSQPYRFLMAMINIAIRNAGVIKMSEILEMSRKVKNADGKEFEKLQAEISAYPNDVQALASEVFGRFAWMLVVNDDLTYWLFKSLKVLTKVTNAAVVGCVKWMIAKIVPRRVQVVREANEFDKLGHRLSPSY